MTIRTRLAWQFAAILAITLLLFSLVIYFFTYQSRRSAFTDSLFARARVVAHVYLDGENRGSKESQISYRRYLRQFYRTLPEEEVRVFDRHNRQVFHEGQGSGRPVPLALLAEVRRVGRHIEAQQDYHQIIGLLYRDARRGDFVVVAASLDADSRSNLRTLRQVLAGGLFISLIIVGIGGWFFARQALQPMQRIVREVDAISASDLHRRLSQADGQDEVSHLAQRFNSLLNRLETAFAGQRTFVRDASHELRTPLTVLIGELEVALLQQERSPAEYRRVLQSTLDAARLLKDLTNGLLQIARASDDPSQVPLRPVPLDELLLQAHEEVQRRQPTCRIDLEFGEPPVGQERQPFVVSGNEPLLLAAFLNVIENACKFSRGTDAPILAILSAGQGRVRLEVRDQGVGMSEADRQQVFVPFFRAETVRNVPGHGIGLPLTAKIMELHGGVVRIASQLGEGTQVTLELPAARS
ncbi:Signal transduction histidine kinase [Hymenobacter daecheongensis DSM 21074]|uniref:histidine kinase n=1 Tax=Hymenobacter daecheongensis DSM 21074 TaxID=1121955 RepID=A0A1M6KIN4_9BACT|nr:HAMP domain-containing sensor histidine kinase [Hymenobacter daecheongensis]SHJ58804.1 Signal transduction histidine kinase [Hymenobacter daecheongensis DSM 21074]